MKPMIKIQQAAREAGYNKIDDEGGLPSQLIKLLTAREVGKYGGQWLWGIVFYKGDPETTNDWIVAFDDGWAYKVDAQFIIWHWDGGEQMLVGSCRWSVESLVDGYLEYFKAGIIARDLEYQT